MSGAGMKLEPFGVTSEQRGHAAHLRVFGEIDMATAPILEQRLHAAESNGNTAIVADLEEVTFIDASGLRAFLRAAERASGRGRAFSIVRAPACVQRILQITGTTHLLAADAIAPPPDHQSAEPSFSAFAPKAVAGGGSDVPGAYNTQRVARAAR